MQFSNFVQVKFATLDGNTLN